MRQGTGDEVAFDDPSLAISLAKLVGGRRGKLAADARLAGDAAVDLENGHY